MNDEERLELGDEPVAVERRPHAGLAVSVTLSAEEARRLFQAAEARGVPISTVAREALLAALAQPAGQQPARRRALG